MKKLLLGAVIALGLISCEKKSNITDPVTPERIEYSLALGGEIDINTDSLGSKTKSIDVNDLIGVQVYAIQDNASSQAYAYGLFDNAAALRISLIKGQKYLFKATLLKEGKTKLRRYPNDWANGSNKPVFFFEPFHLPGSTDSDKGCELTNTFVYSNTISLQGLDKGLSDVGSGSTLKFKRPSLSRYYGESEFTATEGAQISLSLLQTVFGVRYSVKNLTEGSVRFQLEGSIAVNCDATEKDVLYTFEQLSTQKGYSENVNVTAIWVKDNGDEIPVVAQQVPFSRIIRTKLGVDMSKVSKVESGMEITVDNGQIQDGTTVEL